MQPLSIFVRHGESALNRHNHISTVIATGRTDCPLTPLGEGQAQETGRRMADIPLGFAVSSPLIRARRTAELVLSRHAHAPSLFLCPNFTERSLGIFEGCSMDDLQTRYPAYFTDPSLRHWRADFSQHAPGGENLAQVERRVCDGYALLTEKLRNHNIVIFSHLMALRCLIGNLLSLPREEVPHLVIPNATPVILTRTHPPKIIGAFSIDDLRGEL